MRFKSYPNADKPSPVFGILITNLGSPSAPTASAVRSYLAEFLGDPRVVEIPRFIWLCILYGIILVVRPARSAKAYQEVWTEDGSPLVYIGKHQRNALRDALKEYLPTTATIELGMCYGQPSLAKELEKMRLAGVTHLLVLPLYPQYSGATTGATWDIISRTLMGWRAVPEVKFVRGYHNQPEYILALANHIEKYWEVHGKPDKLVFSFHGIPLRSVAEGGDPYAAECRETTRLTVEALGLSEDNWLQTFQSRFGFAEWLTPYTDETMKQLGQEGVKRIDVVCPGFAADCLETIEEINIQNREFFLEAGGQDFHYIPALNASPEHIDALKQLIIKQTRDWFE
ncbi:MAG: ferrochelatase [Pseudomonadota bacterium]